MWVGIPTHSLALSHVQELFLPAPAPYVPSHPSDSMNKRGESALLCFFWGFFWVSSVLGFLGFSGFLFFCFVFHSNDKAPVARGGSGGKWLNHQHVSISVWLDLVPPEQGPSHPQPHPEAGFVR